MDCAKLPGINLSFPSVTECCARTVCSSRAVSESRDDGLPALRPSMATVSVEPLVGLVETSKLLVGSIRVLTTGTGASSCADTSGIAIGPLSRI